MLEAFDNDSIRRILHVRRRDCVPSVELRRNLILKKKIMSTFYLILIYILRNVFDPRTNITS